MKRHPDANCEDCPLNNSNSAYVGSDGPEAAEVVMVGEAPGWKEERTGKPFVGPSGDLINQVLAHHGIDRSKVFVTNTVLCRPPENRTPTKKEIASCASRLEKEIKSRNPSAIIALGNTASGAIMGHVVKITAFRAGPAKESTIYPGVRVIPTFHPANCLRSADSFPSLVADIGKVKEDDVRRFSEPNYAVF